jgi:aconitate hydratase
VTKNLAVEPIGNGKDGKPVFLKYIWPTAKEINAFMK